MFTNTALECLFQSWVVEQTEWMFLSSQALCFFTISWNWFLIVKKILFVQATFAWEYNSLWSNAIEFGIFFFGKLLETTRNCWFNG